MSQVMVEAEDQYSVEYPGIPECRSTTEAQVHLPLLHQIEAEVKKLDLYC